MLTLELSTIQAKDLDRSELAAAMEAFERDGGKIEVAAPIGYVPKPVHWRTDGFQLPGSSTNTAARNRDIALSNRLRDLAATGAGITSLEKTMGIGKTVIYRLAKEFKIEIKKAWANGGVVSVKALKQASLKTQERKARNADKIRCLSVLGLSYHEIADRLELHQRTIRRIADEFGIKIGKGRNG